MTLPGTRVRLLDVTDAGGTVIEALWLARAQDVHRQLRPALPADYVGRMEAIFAGGARLLLAVDGDVVCGLALWRLIENTYEGRRLFVDDLVSDAARRSQGIGAALLKRIEDKARALGCHVVALESGTQRTRAHQFYFRAGMVIPSFCFRKVIA